MSRKILALCLTALLLLSCVGFVSAEEFDPHRTGSISVTLREQYETIPIPGAELTLYYIATVGINTDGQLNYIYTDAFAGTDIAIDDPDLADKLDAYLSENPAEASVLSTDATGTVVWEDLPLGLYFIRQTNSVAEYAPCAPFLVTVPVAETEGYTYDVNASPKTEVAKLTDITIKKVWNTDASTKAADSVTVQLLRKGKAVAIATLNEANNWQVTFRDLPESDAYTVEELDVPNGFTATYKRSGYVFTVTNTSTLIQTGQLIWPIPVLGFAGVLLLMAGCLLLWKKRKENA